MKNIIILATIRTGRTWTAQKIRETLGDKVGAIIVADELYAIDKLDLGKDNLILAMGFAGITGEQLLQIMKDEKDNKASLGLEWCKGLCERSKEIKKLAEKFGFKYFDVRDKRDESLYQPIVDYVKKNI